MTFKLFQHSIPFLFLIALSTHTNGQSLSERISPVFTELRNNNKEILSQKSVVIEKIDVDDDDKRINIVMPKAFSAMSFRNESIIELQNNIRLRLPDSYKNYSIIISVADQPLSFFVPNYYKTNKESDKSRNNKTYKGLPLVLAEDKPYELKNSLKGRHLAIWNSHGIYFEPSNNRWEWQRPRLYGIAEDTYTGSIVIPYLLPMLENAGAVTLLPKERDIQSKEAIVDNDDATMANFIVNNSPKQEWIVDSTGFSNNKKIIYKNDNPFANGTHLKIKGKKNGTSSVEWIPNIPSTGEYSVYISYKSLEGSTTDAHYTVHHSGGETSFSVNQTMGGGTWIYLGKFKFKKGRNEEFGKVVLTNKNKDHGIITADAVRFGGGIGNVARAKSDTLADSLKAISGYPRYLEAARYWLQWAGYPDSVYSTNKGKSEYKDDYMSRALWVNNLIGGSFRNPNGKGKNIPLDAAVAIHSDAGISNSDQIIGSLAIYMTNNNSNYVNGTSRMAARDLSDLIQTQAVNDINKIFNCNWTRRKLTDDSYYEARVPEVPTLLFECLSHQNYQDMKYGLDPHFRFVLARAIYKGLLKYFSAIDNSEYVVQPLPVTHFSAEFYNESKEQVYLSWKDRIDELEPTSQPTSYILYTSKNNNGFDNGVVVTENHTIVDINPDTIYNFKITAINEGGESFPSEVLSVAHASEEKGCALIVNGFERVAGPMNFNTGKHQGFLYKVDPGVPYKNDISYTGRQYDFNKKSEFITNDEPGLGASYGNYEDLIIAGNTFNYPSIHGLAMLDNKYSFVSCGLKAFSEGSINPNKYTFVDLIFGKQKETAVGDTMLYSIYTDGLIDVLNEFLDAHGNLLVTGEYIGSDVILKDECDSAAVKFMEEKLHYTLGYINHKPMGTVTSRTNPDLILNQSYTYFIEPNRYRYHLTSPDVLVPTNSGEIVLRYDATDAACIMYNGKDYKTIVSSIPFETIKGRKQRSSFMHGVINFFESSNTQKKMKMVTLPAKSSLNSKSYISTKKSYKQDFNIKK